MKIAKHGLAGLIAALVAASIGYGQFNPNPKLHIGDPAPPFKVQTWIKGEPINGFEKGKVYVLDFWATWCGGCIISFPHISKIAEKYRGQVRFISLDSYEDVVETNKEKDPAQLVREFLRTPAGQKLKLDVAVDGRSNTMYATWVSNLRRMGMPTTFVIDQDGKIAWIDVNLDHLDWVLQQVVAKKWDRAKAAEVMKRRDAIDDMLMAIWRSQATDKTKDYQAILASTEAFEKTFADRKDAVAFYKFMALSELDKERIPALLDQMAADPLSRSINLSDAAGLTLRRKDLSQRVYAAVAKVQERLLSSETPGYGGENVFAFISLANTYEKAGDQPKAAEFMEKAYYMALSQHAPEDFLAKYKEVYERLKKAAVSVK